MTLPPAARLVQGILWRDGAATTGERFIPEEVAVSLTYNGTSHAVMMATPADLEDFAIGFSLSEGIIAQVQDTETLEVVPQINGIELRMGISRARDQVFVERRRHLAGATGCGLCGIESLDEVMRTLPRVESGLKIAVAAVEKAMVAIRAKQLLNQKTQAVHAAGFWEPDRGLLLREDVGRHNALDKLGGALARCGRSAASGIVVLTSRVSVEMIQKAAMMGAPIVAAVSAPTALAVRSAEMAGITLIAVARDDGFEIFTHRHRIDMKVTQNVA
jgi:FdhD protein